MLTGFGDLESALVAGRLGADEFKAKPIFVDELDAVVRRLFQRVPPDNAAILARSRPDDTLREGLGWLARLLEVLHVSSRETQLGVSDGDGAKALVGALVQSVTNPSVSAALFLACATALRRVVLADQRSGFELISAAENVIREALARSETQDSRVLRALDMVRRAAMHHERLTIERIAGTERVDPAHLGRLIKSQTGFDFTEWRTGFLLRPGLSPLVLTNDHIKQIARSVLGYRYEAQFDRDFNNFFGMTPSALREVYRQREFSRFR